MVLSASATGWLQVTAAVRLIYKSLLTAMARVPTRSVRYLMAPRCSDPIIEKEILSY